MYSKITRSVYCRKDSASNLSKKFTLNQKLRSMLTSFCKKKKHLFIELTGQLYSNTLVIKGEIEGEIDQWLCGSIIHVFVNSE